jgi:glutathione S-transferase
MSNLIVYGFQRSTYVNIVRLVLTHKDVPYFFHDLEPVMGKPEHLALHPFNRVPILKHGDFTVYETSAIASYVDEAFEGPRLTPQDVRKRARMNQWMSAVNSYYYPYMIYHVTHERLVYPELGIASDEKVVRMRYQRSRSRLAYLSANCRTARTICLVRNSRLQISSSCRARLPSASRRKARPCIRSIRHFADGVSGWKTCRRHESCVRSCRHANPYRMRASG